MTTGVSLEQFFAHARDRAPEHEVHDRNEPPAGSVVISGTGLGLPGAEKSVMDPTNAIRLLSGESFIDLLPERFRKQVLAKRINRLVKDANGDGHFEVLTDTKDTIKLAGRPGSFDLTDEYGVPAELVEALDITTQLAMAAGLDALCDAGIPLVRAYERSSTGEQVPGRWMLPQSMRDETGVIFVSAFPGLDSFAVELERYYQWRNRTEQLRELEALRDSIDDRGVLAEISRKVGELRAASSDEPYELDHRFLFRILSMGHSQFAEYIGARGPNAQVNIACASMAQAVAISEDWIRTGRCRRVVIIGADNVTGEQLLQWIGAGFNAIGAAATDDDVENAALPFDRRRHGLILGMGCCSLVVESEDAVRERGMRGIAELLATESKNSAFHGSRLQPDHIAEVMESLIGAVERRFALDRHTMAPKMVFVSHETYTPARGGSAQGEVVALRQTFGASAKKIIVTNTKGYTGHPMSVGIEDVAAVKVLEHGLVPPIANFKVPDPELGELNLSQGGLYDAHYAMHLAAGFGSQVAFTLFGRIPGPPDRVENRVRRDRWLADVSGCGWAETEVERRVLRIKDTGVPTRQPAPSAWQPGTGPTLRATLSGQQSDVAGFERSGQQSDAVTPGQQSEVASLGRRGQQSEVARRAQEPRTAESETPVESRTPHKRAMPAKSDRSSDLRETRKKQAAASRA